MHFISNFLFGFFEGQGFCGTYKGLMYMQKAFPSFVNVTRGKPSSVGKQNKTTKQMNKKPRLV